VGYGLWQLAYASKQDLTADNFNAAYAAMQGMTGDKGKKLGIKLTLLVVPPTLRSQALHILNAEQVNGTTNINRNAVDVLVTPWL
jgi:phage major head subunit gpT-like protein